MQRFLLCGIFLICIHSEAVAQITAFQFESSPTSWVGQGQTQLYTEASGFAFPTSHENGKSVQVRVTGDPHGNWILQFGAPGSGAGSPNDGPRLMVGNYPVATRWPFHDVLAPGSAGLYFVGQGRGPNLISGSFVVREFVPGAGDEVVAFAADFIQFEDGASDAWSRGSIRINSSVPLVPEPTGFALLGSAAIAYGMMRNRNRRRVRR